MAVGMPYFDGKERFWEKQHHHLFGSQGTYLQMVDKVSTIRAFDVFPPEFEEHLDALSRQIKDPKVQQILETLQRAEVSSKGSFTTKEQGLLVRKPYPLWYYARKARRVIRRHFPNRTTGVE